MLHKTGDDCARILLAKVDRLNVERVGVRMPIGFDYATNAQIEAPNIDALVGGRFRWRRFLLRRAVRRLLLLLFRIALLLLLLWRRLIVFFLNRCRRYLHLRGRRRRIGGGDLTRLKFVVGVINFD